MTRSARTLATLAGAAIALASTAAHAQQVFSTFTGPHGGVWSVPSHWDNLTIPDTAGEVALIPGPHYARLNYSITLDKFEIGGVLGIQNSIVLHLRTQTDGSGTTGIFGGGTTALESVGNGTYLRFVGPSGSYATHGHISNPSFIQLSNNTSNIIDAANAGITFYNNGNIFGSGQIGTNSFALANSGAIIAFHSGNSLTIDVDANGATNTGSLQSQGGNLIILNSSVTNSGAGSLVIQPGTGGIVTVSGSSIIGGTFYGSSLPGEELLFVGNSLLDGLLINGQSRIPNANLLYARNSISIGSGSTLVMQSVGNGTYLRSFSNYELNGNGTLSLTNNGANIIDANAAGHVLTNNLLGGIVGSGQLGANSIAVINNGLVEARGSTGLTIDSPGTTPFDNNATVRAATGSSIIILNTNFDNANGLIESQTGAAVYVAGSTVTGGTIATASGGACYFQGNSVIDSPSITFGSTSYIPNANLVYLSNSLINTGTFNMTSVGNGTHLRVLNAASITGGGVIAGTNNLGNIFDANVTGLVLTINNQTIRGSFQLGANSLAITNNGLIEAQGSSGITIDSPGTTPFDNNATVRAATGSSVSIVNTNFDNANGLIESQTGAAVYVSGSTVTGGTITTASGGACYFQANSVIDSPSITSGSACYIPNANLSYLSNSLTNAGTFNMTSVGNGTHLRVLNNASITGGGVIASTNNLGNIFDATTSGLVLTINNQTIRGSFQLGANSLAFTNNGLIEAQGSSGITIDSPGSVPFDNNSIVRALTGSGISIVNTNFDNSGGVVEAQDNSYITFHGSACTGGILTTLGTGAINFAGSSVLQGSTIAVGATCNIPNANVVHPSGTITLNGSLNMNSVGNGTHFRTNSPGTTITGTGIINCTNNIANVFDASVSNQVLTLSGITLRGSLQLGANSLAVINNGTIIADTTSSILIDPPAGGFLNDVDGILRVTAAGTMNIVSGPFSTAGSVIVDAGLKLDRTAESFIQTGGSVIANGEVEVDSNSYLLQGGTLGGSGLVDSSVTNSGGNVSPGQSAGILTIEGSYTQQVNGYCYFEVLGSGGPGTGHDLLTITGNAALGGSIVAGLGSYEPTIGQSFTVLTAASRSGAFTSVIAPGFDVQYTPTSVFLVYTGILCNTDYNQDGGGDTSDIIDLANDLAAGTQSYPPNTTDFNNDGGGDTSDIVDIANAIASGVCP